MTGRAEYIEKEAEYSIEDILEAERKLCNAPASLTEAKRNWFMEGFKVGYFQCFGDYVLNKNKDDVPKKYDHHEFFHHKQTNADRIRAMSDRELAEYLTTMQAHAYYHGMYHGKKSDEIEWLGWLQQEATT